MFVTKNLPKSISVNTKNYRVRTDFHTWIDVESIFTDSNIPVEYKLYVMFNNLDLFYGNRKIFDEPLDAVYDGILSFWRMNKRGESKSIVKSNDVAYDYEEDFELICAAFRQQYNINLHTAKMHWFEYKALFDGLTKDTQFVKIVGYRTVDLNKIPKEQRKEYRELKNFYAIKKLQKHRRSQKEIEAELLASLK